MKGITKKLLAVMLAASMVLQPCISAYAADTGTAAADTGLTGEPSEVEGQTVPETGEETDKESVKTDPEEPENKNTDPGEEQVMQTGPEEPANTKNDPEESENKTDQNAEESRKADTENPSIVEAGKTITITENDSNNWEVYGTLMVKGRAVLSGNINIHENGAILVENGRCSKVYCRGQNSFVRLKGTNTRIEELTIGSEYQNLYGINVNLYSGASAENIYVYGNPEYLSLDFSEGASAKQIVVFGEPTADSQIALNTGCTIQRIELQGTPSECYLEIGGTLEELRLTTEDKTFVPYVIKTSSGQAEAPRGYKWVPLDAKREILKRVEYKARIGETEYESLKDAVEAVPADGSETEIQMIDNEMIDQENAPITVNAGKNIVLDLNGFQVAGTGSDDNTAALITNRGTLTVKDSSSDGAGRLLSGAAADWTFDGNGSNARSSAYTIHNSGILNVESGQIENISGNSEAYAINSDSSETASVVNIEDGTVKAKNNTVRLFAGSAENDNTLNISGGTVSAAVNAVFVQPGNVDVPRAQVNVTGGTVSAPGSKALSDGESATGRSGLSYKLSGGTFDGNIDSKGANLEITGGIYKGFINLQQNEATDFSISGGFFSGEVLNWGTNESIGFITGGYYKNTDIIWEKVLDPGCKKIDNNDAHAEEGYVYKVIARDYVCRIGDVYYETLDEAIAAAEAGNNIYVFKNITSDHTIVIDKPLTISGDHVTLTSTALDAIDVNVSSGQVNIQNLNIKGKRGIGICNGMEADGLSLTIDTCLMQVSERGITSGGNGIKNYSLTLVGCSIDNIQVTDYSADVASGTDTRGISFWNFTGEANINRTSIRGFKYVLNNSASDTGSFSSGAVFNINSGSFLNGWGIVNNFVSGTTWNFLGTSSRSINKHSGATNSFGAVVMNEGATGNTVNFSNCGFELVVKGDQYQTLILDHEDSNRYTFEGEVGLDADNRDLTAIAVYKEDGEEKIDDDAFADLDRVTMDDESRYTFEYYGWLHHMVARNEYTGKKYQTLEEAFTAAKAGNTITLLEDCAGNGIVVPEGKFADGLTVDFDGHTYTVDGETVGSTGTETNGFQLLKDNTITFTGGTITSEKAKILIQNYSNLTLQGMTLTLNKEGYNEAYTLSNNNGNVVIDGSTINANPTGGFAFDVCRFSSYPSVHVTVKGDSTVKGDIEVSASGSDAKEGFGLMLEAGTINGKLVLDSSAEAAMAASPEKAVVRKNDTVTLESPEGYRWKGDGQGVSSLEPIIYTAEIDGIKYETLKEAIADVPADGTETVIKMIANEMIDQARGYITVDAGKNIVLDLNGFVVVGTIRNTSRYYLITNKGTFTLRDDSEDGSGRLISGAAENWTVEGNESSANGTKGTIHNQGTLTIESGSVEDLCYLKNASLVLGTIYNDSSRGNAIVTIKGGNIKSWYGNGIYLDCKSAAYENTLNMTGGAATASYACVRYASNKAGCKLDVNISGGTFSAEKGNSVRCSTDLIDPDIYSAVRFRLSGGYFSNQVDLCGKSVDITGGTYNYVVGIISAGEDTHASISGGFFSTFIEVEGDLHEIITGGYFKTDATDWERLIHPEYKLIDNTDEHAEEGYVYKVAAKEYVCQIEDGVMYETLEEAFAAAEDGDTIILLEDCSGNGIVVPEGKFADGLTVDFDGHTYTVDGETVGSTGTKTNGFQLLKDNTITFIGGTITSEKAKILIQNYSDLTLAGMTLDLNNAEYSSAYTLSNNNGNVMIENSTINTNPAGGFAFDVCRYASYPSVFVMVTDNSIINGNIEVFASNGDAADGFGLLLDPGTYNGDIVLDQSAADAMELTPASAAVMKSRNLTIGAPDGYAWEYLDDDYDILRSVNAARNLTTGHYYGTLAEALAEAESGETVIPLKDIDDEDFVLVMNGAVLDLKGRRVTGATLFYVTGTLKDTGDTRGAFSADAYYLGKSVNSEFPIYDKEDGAYSLYDLNVITWDPSTWKYGFAFGDTEDTEEAGEKILEAEDNGRVTAQVCVNWTERSDNEAETETGSEKEIRKNIAFSSTTLNKYAAAPSRKAITLSFNNLDTVTGTIKATPMFVVYDGSGAVMMTVSGDTWTVRE